MAEAEPADSKAKLGNRTHSSSEVAVIFITSFLWETQKCPHSSYSSLSAVVIQVLHDPVIFYRSGLG